MSAALHLPAQTDRKVGRALLVRWLLVLLLAFDLIGSPLHAHHHDLGADGLASHAMQSAGGAGGVEPAHLEADDAHAFGHSLAALRPAKRQIGAWQAAVQVAAVAPHIAGRVATPESVPLGWRIPIERIPISTDLRLHPEGRAPPLRRT